MKKPRATRAEISAARTDQQLDALQKKYNYSDAFIKNLKAARASKPTKEEKEREDRWKYARIGF